MLARRLRNATAGSVATGLTIQAGLAVSGPLVARALGVEGRGELAALVLWPAILGQIGTAGLPLALTFRIAQTDALPRAMTRRLVLIALAQVALIVLLHWGILAFRLRGASDGVRAAGVLTLALGPAFVAREYGLAMLQGRRDFRRFNAARLIPLLYPASIVALFITGERSIVAVTLMVVGANLSTGLVTLVLGIRGLRLAAGEDGVGLGETLRFGVRGFFGHVSPIEALRVDQLVITLFFAPAALGLYVVGTAFTNASRFAAKSVGLVAYPRVTEQGADPALARRAMWPYVWLAGALSMAIVAPLVVLAPALVPLFFGSEFAGAVQVMQLLLPGMVFLGVRRTLADGLRGRGYPGAGTVAEVISWVVLAVGLTVLAPLWGIEGVALAMTLTQLAALAALLAAGAALGEVRLREAVVLPRELWTTLRAARAASPE